MTVLLPAALMFMQVGVNPATGQTPGIPDELRDRPPRAAVATDRPAGRSAIDVCLSTAREDPAKARALAQEWVSRTTGSQRATGHHCLAVAAGNAGDWASAAAAFLAARDDADAPRFRARMGALAGSALLTQGKPGEALAVLDRAAAEKSADSSLEGYIAQERAVALVALERLPEAALALDAARALAPADAHGWLLSATLARRQGDLATAQTRIERAAALDPRDPGIGLEAGVIAALAGRDAAARQSFQSVIAAAPESEQAAAARTYLSQLSQ